MNPRPVRTYRGSCHCQAVQFEIETDFPELTTCDCSICRRRKRTDGEGPRERPPLLAGREALVTYRFHTHPTGIPVRATAGAEMT